MQHVAVPDVLLGQNIFYQQMPLAGYTVEDIAKDIVKANVALTKKDQGAQACFA